MNDLQASLYKLWTGTEKKIWNTVYGYVSTMMDINVYKGLNTASQMSHYVAFYPVKITELSRKS